MSSLTGEELAVTLLKALPSELADRILGKLPEESANRVRTRLENFIAAGTPLSNETLSQALRDFFDQKKMLEAPPLQAAYGPGSAGNSGAKTSSASTDAGTNGTNGTNGSAGGTETSATTVEKNGETAGDKTGDARKVLAAMSPDILARALSDEQVPTIAIVMGYLEGDMATMIMRRLPAHVRPELAMRLTQPGFRNQALTERLIEAIVDKAQKMGDLPSEPSVDERVQNLANMMRGLTRQERLEILEAMDKTEQTTANRVRDLIFRFDDILRVDDRALQTLLTELDMPTLALALMGSDENISKKISANMSERARGMLKEEMSLLGKVLPSKTTDARTKIVSVMRTFEAEGKIEIETS